MPKSKDLTRDAWRDVFKGFEDATKPATSRLIAEVAKVSHRQPKHNFEIVPRPRNIIVLEDHDESGDDDWENIDKAEAWNGKARNTKSKASYAAVASKRGGKKAK
jgi:hypothetical protein